MTWSLRPSAASAARGLGKPREPGICLQLSERDVLGVVGLGPPQLLGQVPGPTPEHGVAEEADRHSPDAGEPVQGDIRRDPAPVHGLVQGDSVWERKSVGASSSCSAGTSIPSLANWRTTPQSTTNLVIWLSTLPHTFGASRDRPALDPRRVQRRDRQARGLVRRMLGRALVSVRPVPRSPRSPAGSRKTRLGPPSDSNGLQCAAPLEPAGDPDLPRWRTKAR
jgi:hypothetical protein